MSVSDRFNDRFISFVINQSSIMSHCTLTHCAQRARARETIPWQGNRHYEYGVGISR